MSNISDVIEKFIMSSMGDENSLEISRNSLAKYFSCAPSQINYVLDTRFTIDRGYLKESTRGSAGSIVISKLKNFDDNAYLSGLINESIGDELSQKRMNQIIEKIISDEIVTKKEGELVKCALSDDSLSMPFAIKDKIRARAFKNILLSLMKK